MANTHPIPTTDTPTTRRGMMAAAVALAATATLPAAASTAPDPDATFLDLWRDLHTGYAKLEACDQRCKDVETSLPPWVRNHTADAPLEWTEAELAALGLSGTDHHGRLSRGQIVTINQGREIFAKMRGPDALASEKEQGIARLAAFEAKVAQLEREVKRVRDESGMRALLEQSDRLTGETADLELAILRKPALGYVGLLVKIAVLADTYDLGNEGLFAPVLADLERLTGRKAMRKGDGA